MVQGKQMAVTTDDISPSSGLGTWRTPLVIIICGCLIALLSFGPRSSLGFFVQPMSRDFAWGRDVFGLALALQNLLWGLGQPIAGAIAATGVDYASSGALTHSAPNFDVALDIDA